MKPHNCLYTMLFAKCQIAAGGKAAISKKHLSGFKQREDPAQQRAFVFPEFCSDPVKQSARVETKTGDHLHDRKTAAGPLHGGSREGLLIGGSVRQTNSCSVDNPDSVSTPRPVVGCLPGRFLRRPVMDSVEPFDAQLAPRLTIG